MSSASRQPPPALSDDGWCFVCGKENPLGLRLAWALDADGKAATRFRAARHHQGWIGVVHGGILAAVLDEAMAQRLRLGGLRTVTARLDVRFRRPAPVDVPLIAEGWIESESTHGMHLRAVVRDEGGTRFAEAVGTCVQMKAAPRQPADDAAGS